jgi:hypothetical protein
VRSWLAIVGLVVAGCGKSPHGLAIEVKGAGSATFVELFIGDGVVTDAGSCGGMGSGGTGSGCSIGPPSGNGGNGQYYTGNGWSMSETDSYRVKLVDSPWVHLESRSAEDVTLPALMIVAEDDNANALADLVLHDVEVSSSGREIQALLLPSVNIRSSAGERLQVWRQPMDTLYTKTACAVVIHDAGGATEFFSPTVDQDCDGAHLGDQMNPECSAMSSYNWCGNYGASLSEASCIAATGTSCRLAGPACADRSSVCTAPSGPCVPVDEPVVCMPTTLCHDASTMGCDLFDDTCVGKVAPNTLPRITCQMTLTSISPCPMQIDATIFAGAGRMCTGLQLVPIASPPRPGLTAIVNGETFTLIPDATNPCIAELDSKALVNSAGATMMLDVANGLEHRYVPLTITYQTGATCVAPPATCLADSGTTAIPCP